MASILIIYGSTSGNTELVCYKVANILESAGHNVDIQRAELSSADEIRKYDLCVLAAPTYGHGIIQPHMGAFISEMKKLNMKDQGFAVIGLGNVKYDPHYNIESAIIIENAIKGTNGDLIQKSLMINENPVWQMNKVKTWAESLIDSLKKE